MRYLSVWLPCQSKLVSSVCVCIWVIHVDLHMTIRAENMCSHLYIIYMFSSLINWPLCCAEWHTDYFVNIKDASRVFLMPRYRCFISKSWNSTTCLFYFNFSSPLSPKQISFGDILLSPRVQVSIKPFSFVINFCEALNAVGLQLPTAALC